MDKGDVGPGVHQSSASLATSDTNVASATEGASEGKHHDSDDGMISKLSCALYIPRLQVLHLFNSHTLHKHPPTGCHSKQHLEPIVVQHKHKL